MEQHEEKQTKETVETPIEAQEVQAEAQGEQQAAAEQSDEAQEQLVQCQAELRDWKDKFMHVSADLQNFKRRIEKERATWILRAQEDVLIKLLAIVDDFDRALSEHQRSERTPEFDAWLKGFELIGASLYKFLAQVGVKPIEEVATFDPQLHEAIVQVEDPEQTSDTIIDVVLKGYMFHDQVLRPAKVTVAK